MNWFKKIFSFLYPFWLLIILYLLDLMFESINASTVDYFIVFILGSVFATLRILSIEITANRIMNLILYHTLARNGIIDHTNTFITQNYLVGHTPITDGDKLIKNLRSCSIYLHEYLTDEEISKHIKEIETNDFSVFSSFIGLTDKCKESYMPKIKINHVPYKDQI